MDTKLDTKETVATTRLSVPEFGVLDALSQEENIRRANES